MLGQVSTIFGLGTGFAVWGDLVFSGNFCSRFWVLRLSKNFSVAVHFTQTFQPVRMFDQYLPRRCATSVCPYHSPRTRIAPTEDFTCFHSATLLHLLHSHVCLFTANKFIRLGLSYMFLGGFWNAYVKPSDSILTHVHSMITQDPNTGYAIAEISFLRKFQEHFPQLFDELKEHNERFVRWSRVLMSQVPNGWRRYNES